MSEADPLGVFLVKSGSKGDRLLFRYPFSENVGKKATSSVKNCPFSVMKNRGDDLWASEDEKNNESDLLGLFNFSDKVLSNLFAVQTELCGQQFELKIEDVRFVGHPTYLSHASTRELSTLTMFHVVFALKASASHSIVNSYHDLSRRLSVAIHFEERRCSFLTQQVKLIQTAHDEIASLPEDSEESAFALILTKSKLAMNLKQLFEELTNTGTIHVKINDWSEMSFCLPYKVHQLLDDRLNITQDLITKCLKDLRPYHGILLLQDMNELLVSLLDDVSPALVRLIRVYSPLKNLQHLAADADLILPHVFQLVGHLVAWCKAIVIYPLCDNNVYMNAPHARRNIHSSLAKVFSDRFPNMNLFVTLSQFTMPTSLSLLSNPMNLPNQQTQQVQMVIWLLQHRFLIQLHTYVVFLPSIPAPPNEDGDFSTTPRLSPDQWKGGFDEDFSLKEQDYYQFLGLTEQEKQSILKESSSGDIDDLKNFLRLLPYFKGCHHLEEIMYCENIRRSQLLKLMDKYRKILITYQCEDAAVAAFHNYS